MSPEEAIMEEDLAECPTCGELIPEDAGKCPECGEEFDEGFEEEMEEKTLEVAEVKEKPKAKPKMEKKFKKEKDDKKKFKEDIQKEKEMDKMPETSGVKYTLLIIGIIFTLIGMFGVVGLRTGIVQSLLGDASAYPGIGSVEPTGHIVSMIPFALGLVTIFIWGIKNEPLYVEKGELVEEEKEDKFSFEDDVDEEDVSVPEPVKDIPIKARPQPQVAEKPKPHVSKEPVSKPPSAEIADVLDEIDAEIEAEDIEDIDELDGLAENLAEEERKESCRAMLIEAIVLDEDRKELSKQILLGASEDAFKIMVKKAEQKKIKKEGELKKQYEKMDADEIGQSLEDELAAELALLEEELEEDDEEDLEEKILKEIEDLEDL